VIPLEPTVAMLQCLAYPASLESLKTRINAHNAISGVSPIALESAAVPCLRLPIQKGPGLTVALGVIEAPEANWGMGLVPPMIAAGSASPNPPLPEREDMEREMIGLLRSVQLPNVKSTSDLIQMLDPLVTWDEFEELTLPALWEEFSGSRHHDSGERK